MPKRFGTIPRRRERPLSWNDFYDTNADLLNGLLKDPDASRVGRSVTLQDMVRPRSKAVLRLPPRSPMIMAADRLNELGVGRALRAAESDNSPEAFKKILQVLFIYLGVSAPNGVFSSKAGVGKPGRPISSESGKVYSTWIRIGEPSIFKMELAQAVYGPVFTAANGVNRRKMRDKCRRAVERHVERTIAKLQKDLASTRN
jgi:hypothetical protein